MARLLGHVRHISALLLAELIFESNGTIVASSLLQRFHVTWSVLLAETESHAGHVPVAFPIRHMPRMASSLCEQSTPSYTRSLQKKRCNDCSVAFEDELREQQQRNVANVARQPENKKRRLSSNAK